MKMAAMRRLAPELMVTAKTQRWKPEEFLRTLIEAEIAARDASNARTRMRQAAFPVTKTLEEFDVAASSIPRVTFVSAGPPFGGLYLKPPSSGGLCEGVMTMPSARSDVRPRLWTRMA